MKSAVIKRSVKLERRKTSVSLEDAFWTALKEIAHSQGGTVASLIGAIEARKPVNLSSAIRIFVLEHHRNKDRSAEQPHSTRATGSGDEGRSTHAWRGVARRA